MKLLAMAVAVSVLAGCATERGNQRHAQHARDQIEMVAIQQQSRVQEANADAEADRALVEALAEVAKANPDHAPAVTVALAVIGVRNQGGDDADAPVVTLQQQRNEALEWTKALAPTVGGLVNGLGVAAIQASVTKKQAEITRDIQINDANSDVSIVEAVAGLGTAAANSVGVEVGGDYYSVTDSGVIDQSIDTTDSYNTTSTTSTEVSLNTTLNYDGSAMTLAELIEQLQAAGASYSIEVDGVAVADGEGEGEILLIDCTQPQFSPSLDC